MVFSIPSNPDRSMILANEVLWSVSLKYHLCACPRGLCTLTPAVIASHVLSVLNKFGFQYVGCTGNTCPAFQEWVDTCFEQFAIAFGLKTNFPFFPLQRTPAMGSCLTAKAEWAACSTSLSFQIQTWWKSSSEQRTATLGFCVCTARPKMVLGVPALKTNPESVKKDGVYARIEARVWYVETFDQARSQEHWRGAMKWTSGIFWTEGVVENGEWCEKGIVEEKGNCAFWHKEKVVKLQTGCTLPFCFPASATRTGSEIPSLWRPERVSE